MLILLGSFNEGSQFLVLVANPVVETPPKAKLRAFLEASMGVAIYHFSSKSFRGDPPMAKTMILLGSFNEGVTILHVSSKSWHKEAEMAGVPPRLHLAQAPVCKRPIGSSCSSLQWPGHSTIKRSGFSVELCVHLASVEGC